MRDDPVEVSGEYLHDTELAVLMNLGDENAWFPKSQIVDYSDTMMPAERGTPLTFSVPEWLAYEKGII